MPVLLVLHGTGGDEHDLIPLGRELLPGAAILSPRGQVLENGMPRFFRRLAEGVFDLEDLRVRAGHLASFVTEAAAHYAFDRHNVIAIGFSNGANIAAGVVLLHPGALKGAVLFRAMVPVVPEPGPNLAGTSVLLSNGRVDPLVSADETERLAALLTESGAGVTLKWQNAGHTLTMDDVEVAREWLNRL